MAPSVPITCSWLCEPPPADEMPASLSADGLFHSTSHASLRHHRRDEKPLQRWHWRDLFSYLAAYRPQPVSRIKHSSQVVRLRRNLRYELPGAGAFGAGLLNHSSRRTPKGMTWTSSSPASIRPRIAASTWSLPCAVS